MKLLRAIVVAMAIAGTLAIVAVAGIVMADKFGDSAMLGYLFGVLVITVYYVLD